MSYWLRWQLGDFPLGSGTYFVGRSPAAHVVLNDPRISRSHASVTIDENGVILRDLNSQNGVYVNGRRVTEQALTPGDRILIGGHELELVHVEGNAERQSRSTRRELSATQRISQPEELDPDSGWSTRRADPIELLATVAEKTLALGRAADAERMMQGHLKTGLDTARRSGELTPDRAERLASIALRLAVVLKKPDWVNYVFDLYGALRTPCPPAIVETLYGVVRQISGVSLPALRSYIGVLRARSDFGPAERFLAQRIEGLERVLLA